MTNLENNFQRCMDSRTKDMEIDIDAVKAGEDPVSEIDFLRNIKSFRAFDIEDIPKEKVVVYIVMLYSHDSIFNKKPPTPLPERKLQALAFAELESNDQVEKEVLNLENILILKMVQDFLIAQRQNLWTEIVTTETQYEEAIRLRLNPIIDGSKSDSELKKALRTDCKEMNADIDVFYRKFYADHDDVKNKVRKKATTLEAIAQSTKND